MKASEYIFEIRDPEGIWVLLSKEVWNEKLLDPVIGHPEVEPYLSEIKFTVEEPDFIYQSARDERSKLFYKAGLTRGKYSHCFVLVVVKYVKELLETKGYISTAMLTTHIKKRGGLLWQR